MKKNRLLFLGMQVIVKIKLLSPENMKKSWERINNPDIVTGRYKLKELLEEVGIVVNPEAMTFWYKHTK